MFSKILLILLGIFPISSVFSQSFGLPLFSDTDTVVEHSFYTLQYNEELELASWVAYELTRQEVEGVFPRSEDFRIDPKVSSGSARPYDYRNTGFDRGHLAPSGDMKLTARSMSESFFMSNMAPQRPGFNRGIWLRLEKTVRTWAVENQEIFVVTGPLLNQPSYQRIGRSNVAVPEAFFKVILDYREPELKAIGFILPNQSSSLPLRNYAVSIDQVEEATGIDFFPQLPEELEKALESGFHLELWSFVQYQGKRGTPPPSPPLSLEKGRYWINSASNVRHNSSCRYYGKTKDGYYTNDLVGRAGKICGG